VSWPPTISRVGALTLAKASPARSGRPLRDTTAPTASGRCAAAMSAAAAPVLAPKSPIRRSLKDAWLPTQSSAPVRRFAKRPMSKRKARVYRSIRSSSSVRRSAKRTGRRLAPQVPGRPAKTPAHGVPQNWQWPASSTCQAVRTYRSRRKALLTLVASATSWTEIILDTSVCKPMPVGGRHRGEGGCVHLCFPLRQIAFMWSLKKWATNLVQSN
jgi:hypothetical protein